LEKESECDSVKLFVDVTELETIWLAVWDKLRESLNEQLVDVE
jgi:hypothetical protein